MSIDPLVSAALLGLVEGVTEFLPVSSTGHLIVASDLLGFSGESAKTFEIFIQLGAILAIAWLYRARLAAVTLGAFTRADDRRFGINLLVAFVPVAVVGLLLHHWIKAHLFRPEVVAGALVAGGLLILLIEWWRRAHRTEDQADVTPRTALGIGLAQILSLIPGVSRSGATILGGYALGLSRLAATEFSFFLAIPVMCAATVFDLVDSLRNLATGDLPIFAVGFLVAFLSALVVVRSFLRYIVRHDFTAFAWYRIALGVILLWYYQAGGTPLG